MKKVFATNIYHETLSGRPAQITRLNKQLILETRDVKSLDSAGSKWSKDNYKNGYTSYASVNELHKYSPTFSELEQILDKHVSKFAKFLDLNLGGRPLKMVSCWVNYMEKNTQHTMHIHPLSVISGTYYVSTPKGSSPIKFEDPRLGQFMSAPPKKEHCKEANKNFIEIPAKAGKVVLFESWLRHEVPTHLASQPRISVSFNYAW